MKGVHDNHRKGEHTGGLSHRDIAKLLGVSHGTVINIEKRALAKMAKIAREEKMMVAEMFERAGRDRRPTRDE